SRSRRRGPGRLRGSVRLSFSPGIQRMQNLAGPPVVLASSSPYRRALLGRVLDRFECVAPDVDETPQPGEAPAGLARRLARGKAEAVAHDAHGAVVIGADQVATLDGRVLGKPGGHDRALEQL